MQVYRDLFRQTEGRITPDIIDRWTLAQLQVVMSDPDDDGISVEEAKELIREHRKKKGIEDGLQAG